MFDFFDEDFPLSKKQEEEAKRLAALKEAEKIAEESTLEAPLELHGNEPEIEDTIAVFGGIEEEIAEEPDELLELDELDDVQEIEELEALDEAPEEAEEVEEINEFVDPFDEELAQPVEEITEAPAEEPIEDDIEALLHEELRSLGEKLDNMERAVDTMEFSENETSADAEFSYEYNEEFYAEEETPAYKHPELHQKKVVVPVRKKKKPTAKNIDTKTAVQLGAAVFAAIAAISLLGGNDEK